MKLLQWISAFILIWSLIAPAWCRVHTIFNDSHTHTLSLLLTHHMIIFPPLKACEGENCDQNQHLKKLNTLHTFNGLNHLNAERKKNNPPDSGPLVERPAGMLACACLK